MNPVNAASRGLSNGTGVSPLRPVPVSDIEVRVLRSPQEVEDIRGIWSSWKTDRDGQIDFYLNVVQARDGVMRPHVILVYRNGRPAGMLVGRLERTRLSSKIGYLHFPVPLRQLTFGFRGLRGNPDAEICRALVTSLRESLRRGEADTAFLHDSEPDSALHQLCLELPGFLSRDHLPALDKHYFMNLPENIEQVFAGLSRDHRSELRRKAKKLNAAFEGRVKVECFRAPDEIEAAIPQIEAVAKKTYQRGIGVGFADTPQMRRRLRFCGEKGWQRAFLLSLDGRLASFWLGTVVDGEFISDCLAFDPAQGAYSPGTFLMVKVFEALCSEGVRQIDFGTGDGRYKARFGNADRLDAPLYIFASHPKGILLNLIRTVTDGIDSGIKSALQRTHLLPKIKRLWRMRAAHAAEA